MVLQGCTGCLHVTIVTNTADNGIIQKGLLQPTGLDMSAQQLVQRISNCLAWQ